MFSKILSNKVVYGTEAITFTNSVVDRNGFNKVDIKLYFGFL